MAIRRNLLGKATKLGEGGSVTGLGRLNSVTLRHQPGIEGVDSLAQNRMLLPGRSHQVALPCLLPSRQPQRHFTGPRGLA
jgi:hypothetical protein